MMKGGSTGSLKQGGGGAFLGSMERSLAGHMQDLGNYPFWGW